MRFFTLLHRWTGGCLGLLLALLGLTGAILVHRRSWILLPHAGDTQVQDTQSLAGVVQRLMADPTTRPQTIVFAERDFGLDRLAYNGGAGAYTDQAGSIVTRWSSQWQRPELWLYDLHRHLLAGDTGETAVGIVGLAGIGFVVTGMILRWRTRRTFAFRLWPKRLSQPAIVRHHRDLGIMVAPLLLLSFITGALLIFRPLTAIVFGPAAPTVISRVLRPPPASATKIASQLDWAGMVVIARTHFPQAEIRSLSLPRGRKIGLITLRMRQPQEWLRGGRTVAWFAADSGRLLAVRDARDTPAVATANNLIFPLHAAEIGGLAYRLVMTASGLALTLLGTLTVWTFWFKSRPTSNLAGPALSESAATPQVSSDAPATWA